MHKCLFLHPWKRLQPGAMCTLSTTRVLRVPIRRVTVPTPQLRSRKRNRESSSKTSKGSNMTSLSIQKKYGVTQNLVKFGPIMTREAEPTAQKQFKRAVSSHLNLYPKAMLSRASPTPNSRNGSVAEFGKAESPLFPMDVHSSRGPQSERD